MVAEERGDANIKTSATDLDSALEKCGLADATQLTVYLDHSQLVFDVKMTKYAELSVSDLRTTSFFAEIMSAGSIKKAILHFNSAEFNQYPFDMLQTNTGLQELNVSYYGHNVLYYADQVLSKW